MAARKSKMGFAIKRFKGFWNQFSKSKRGMTGIIIVAFFSFMAIFAPLIAPYAPIDPKKDEAKYPPQTTPPKIAEKLCTPEWYEYIPWVQKGSIQLKEAFWTNITELGDIIFVNFGRLNIDTTDGYISKDTIDKQRQNATDDYIRLSKATIEPPQVDVTFPNGTSKLGVSSEEWWNSRSPAVVGGQFGSPEYRSMRSFVLSLNGTLGKDLVYTIFEVTYMYSSDVTKNVELVPDFQFSSEQTFNEEWDSTTLIGSAHATYNSEDGFNKDGCIEVTYNPMPSENESKVVLSKQFEYPFVEPPESFWGHLSTHVESVYGIKVNITITIQREGGELIPIVKLLRDASTLYTHKTIYSTNKEVIQTTRSLTPEKLIFSQSGTYTLAIEIVFNGNDHTSICIDNFNILLYGNSFGLLGTDNALGYPRDIFSTLIYGTQVSLMVGVLSAVFSTVIGLFLGLVSGYVGGLTDEGIMRVADLFLVLPTLPLFIILVVALKMVYNTVSIWNIIIVLTLFGWMGFARSVRSMVLSLRERPFIEAAKAAGAGKFYIINRHVLPNVFALVYITLATAVPGAIVTEASLSWLGLGDPMVPSWGKLLYDFQSSGVAVTRGLTDYWFWMFPACIAIAVLATAFILMGYALDEILNPRLRQRR
jgi:ABC-type dipeptide/oligopeptide/nickel transport system permease subunit